MNILIVSQYFYPENFRINELASEWVKKGHRVKVLTGIPNYPDGKFFDGYGLFRKRKEKYQGIDIIRIPLIPRGKGANWELALNYISFVLSGVFWAPWLVQGKFDCIFVFGISPITAALPAIVLKKIKRTPLFLWVLDLWPQSVEATNAVRSKILLGWIGGIAKLIYKHCDRILIASKSFGTAIEGFGVSKKKIYFFPNWAEDIYTGGFDNQNENKMPSLPTGFRVMFAGSVGAAQDFPTILSAAEILKDHTEIHWIIVGDGRMWEWVKDQVEKRGLDKTVHILGRYPLDSMPYFFRLADAFLVTLKKNPVFALTVPGKIQSYLAFGRPIIAALEGDGREVVLNAKAGMVVPPESPDDLARAVLAMSRLTEGDRRQQGMSARAYHERNFDRKLLFGIMDVWLDQWCQDKAFKGGF